MRLLIIDDDFGITLALKRALDKSYTVDIAHTAADGIRKVRAYDYTVIILDLNLPDRPGLEVCQEIRKSGESKAPILVLSGESGVTSKVDLLDAGAADYLTKPFSLEELKARLRVLLRHIKSPKPIKQRLVVGDLILDTERHTVERAGQPIELRRKEFALLECLMSHAGAVVTRSILTEHAWEGDEDIWTNVVDVHIKHLRDKIDRPFDTPLIKTVHGLGYKLEVKQPVANITKGGSKYERVTAKSAH